MAEALIVMFIVCMVVVCATPAITKSVKKLGDRTSHGTYICYYNGTQLVQRYAGGDEKPATGGCSFKLRKSNAYFLIRAVGNGNNTFPGQYVSLYRPRTEAELLINVDSTTNDFVISSKATNPNKVLITALSAKTSVNTNLYPDNVKSCALLDAPANCNANQGAQSGCMKTINPGSKLPALKITDCGSETFVDIATGDLKVDTSKTVKDVAGNTVNSGIYIGGGKKIAIEFYDPKFPNLTTAQSGLMEELGTANANTPPLIKKIIDLQAGNRGHRGAVLIQW